ncbi:MAG: L,D-transpeptidase [Acidobacteria bacterium]|nr:L,D-transpeptidase [Acidobacteriota bacterium]
MLALLVAALGLVLAGAAPAGASPATGSGIDHIDVSLGSQRVRVWGTDGTLIRDFPVSTGSRGRTPSGSFRIYRRSASTISTTDYITTMQWMTNFTGGIGFHGIPRKYGQPLYTPLGERPVSAGCVRMADADAEWIYRNAPNGTRVNVK